MHDSQNNDHIPDSWNTSGDIATNARSWRAWGGYLGSSGKQSSVGGYQGYDSTSNGVITGVSKDFAKASTLSFYGAVTRGDFGYDGSNTKIDLTGYHLGRMVTFRPMENFKLAANARPMASVSAFIKLFSMSFTEFVSGRKYTKI